MSLQKCTDINEAVPLEVGLGLYLKPTSKIKISVQLPKLRAPGQSISTWQVMEKLRSTVRPDQFLSLKALKITSTVIKFLGELETRSSSERALARLQAAGGIKLSGFSEFLQIRGAHAACSGPTRHDWDSFFRDARGVDEMKPGERPDTIYLQDLPTAWFSESTNPIKPSERLLHKAFSTFGRIRRLEIPSNSNSTEEQTFRKTSSLYKDLTFQVYIQYEEYVEFATAMDSLRGKKLLHKDLTDGRIYAAEIKLNRVFPWYFIRETNNKSGESHETLRFKVDFDRTNYLSEKNIKKRALESKKNSDPDNLEILNDSAICLDQNLNLNIEHHETVVSSPDIANENAKKEAVLLLKELLQRSEMTERKAENSKLMTAVIPKKEQEESQQRGKKHHEKLIHQEQVLKEKLLRSLKAKEQQKTVQLREKLRKELAGQKLLSVLANVNYQTLDSKRLKSLKKLS